MKAVTIHTATENYLTTASDGTHQWIIDEPADKGGGDRGPDPVSMLLASIGSCTAITLRMYAQRKGWDVHDINIRMEIGGNTSGGTDGTLFSRFITVAGNLDELQLQRLHQIARACPVSRMLEGTVSIDTYINNGNHEHSATG
jgi:putative redox protein